MVRSILINTVPSFDLIGQKLTKICLFMLSIECRVTVSIMNNSTVQQQQQQQQQQHQQHQQQQQQQHVIILLILLF